jgi:ribonucleoside-diphosphate reductase alpha chain
MAASLAALVTAECYAASAEMAGLRGASDAFTANREAIMRSLRNHRRAIYGDRNDYEKLSVLPSALPLKNCPDLNLVAEAQRRWDEALKLAQAFGLRATQVTDLTPSPLLAMLMSSASQGLEPLQHLTGLRQDEADLYRVTLHPVVGEALARLDYPSNTAETVAQHIVGARSLRKAPAINHATLRARGLSDTALEKIEAYLPCVNTVRLAVTPWIIGVDFCVTQLKISAKTLESPRFDLLRHLGFTDADCDAANLYCYGFGTVHNAKILNLRHRPLFACGAEISAEARLRMAAAVQSFVSGDTGAVAHLPVEQSIENGAEMTLAAWRSGLKSLTVVFDPAIAARPERKAATTIRRIKAASQPHAKPMASMPRRAGSGKTVRSIVAKKSAPVRRAAR